VSARARGAVFGEGLRLTGTLTLRILSACRRPTRDAVVISRRRVGRHKDLTHPAAAWVGFVFPTFFTPDPRISIEEAL